MVDLDLSHTSYGRLSLATAAIGDAITWAGLTVLVALGSAARSGLVTSLAIAVAFVAVMVLVVRPVLAFGLRWAELRPTSRLLPAVLLAAAIAIAGAAQLLGLHPLVGALLFGAVVPVRSRTVEELNEDLRGFAVVVLLPLFFAGVGLSVSLTGSLGHAADWLVLGVVLVVACLSKFAGAYAGARLAGLSRRPATSVGALMNCRGVTELVVASVGLQSGFVSPVGFTILVVMALVTTALTTPLLSLINRGRIEPHAPDALVTEDAQTAQSAASA